MSEDYARNALANIDIKDKKIFRTIEKKEKKIISLSFMLVLLNTMLL